MTSDPLFTGPELCGLEAHEIVNLLKAKKISSAELIDAAVARIDQTDPMINATPTLCEARARAVDLSNQDNRPGRLSGGLADHDQRPQRRRQCPHNFRNQRADGIYTATQ